MHSGQIISWMICKWPTEFGATPFPDMTLSPFSENIPNYFLMTLGRKHQHQLFKHRGYGAQASWWPTAQGRILTCTLSSPLAEILGVKHSNQRITPLFLHGTKKLLLGEVTKNEGKERTETNTALTLFICWHLHFCQQHHYNRGHSLLPERRSQCCKALDINTHLLVSILRAFNQGICKVI